MEPTQPVTLSLRDAATAGPVAAEVALGMALRAGFPPLAADRVRRAVREALEGSPASEITAEARPGEVRLRVTAADAGWRSRALGALAAHEPAAVDGGLVVVFRSIHRGALRAVEPG
jgi:hypothetical protein